jgi:hypothetical protein
LTVLGLLGMFSVDNIRIGLDGAARISQPLSRKPSKRKNGRRLTMKLRRCLSLSLAELPSRFPAERKCGSRLKGVLESLLSAPAGNGTDPKPWDGLELRALVRLTGQDDTGEKGDTGANDSSGPIAAMVASRSTAVLTGRPPPLEAGNGGLGDEPGVITADTDDGGLPDVDSGEAARFVVAETRAWVNDGAGRLLAAGDERCGEDQSWERDDSASGQGP